MKKVPKGVFTFTEAGLGHIMPLKSIADAFTKKYSDKVEIVLSNFFNESNKPSLINYEKFLVSEVKKQNRYNWYGYFTTIAMDVFGPKIDNWFLMKFLHPKAFKDGVLSVDEIDADLIVTTHWATNYYAVHSKSKPLTATYVPDVFINPVFRYKSDLTLCSMQTGYDEAISRHKKRFNSKNLKLVPFCIREEAYNYSSDKVENRKKLGLPLNKFTITLAEGGYGIGKMEKICKIILDRDLPITCIPLCGKNEELYNNLTKLKNGKNAEIRPIKFTKHPFGYLASSDLFLGKSGANMIAEPTFFGVPTIITKHATNIEKHIADYYVNYLKCALNILEPQRIVDKIESFLTDKTELEIMANNAKKAKDLYGAEKTADEIFELLKTKYPNL